MKDFWETLEKDILTDLHSRKLAVPSIRQNALKDVVSYCKFKISDLYILELTLNRKKSSFKLEYAKYKNKAKCNGAEESVINDIFKYIEEKKYQMIN